MYPWDATWLLVWEKLYSAESILQPFMAASSSMRVYYSACILLLATFYMKISIFAMFRCSFAMGSPFPKKFLPARNPYPCFPPGQTLRGML